MTKNLNIPYPTYSFSVEVYHMLADKGILKEQDRVELIEGKIVTISPIRSPHAACVERLGDVLRNYFGQDAIIRSQNPVTLGTHSEPEPDLAVVNYREDYYEDAHPVPGDIQLLIEIAQSSEDYDREIKIPLYAKFDIPEAWLVNLNRKEVEVYLNPSPEGYNDISICRYGNEVKSKLIKDLSTNRIFRE